MFQMYTIYAKEYLSSASSPLIFSNEVAKPLSLLKDRTEISIHAWQIFDGNEK